MGDSRRSASGDIEVTDLPKHLWKEKMAATKKKGLRVARAFSESGDPFAVRPLGTKVVREGDTVPLTAVVIKLDWKIATRLEMVESAKDMITNAYILDSLDSTFPAVLKSIIEGTGLYEYSIGEFFQLYGKFEGKHKLTNGPKTKKKMETLVNGDTRYLKLYKEHSKSVLYPLPYAVRNILAHAGHNPNRLDEKGKELRTSIELLRSWVDLGK